MLCALSGPQTFGKVPLLLKEEEDFYGAIKKNFKRLQKYSVTTNRR